jgi:hypothetical protein
MKNSFKYIVTFSISMLLIISCSKDRLNVEPVNEYLSNNYYQTEAQIGSALIGAYDPIGWSMAFGQWISPTMYGEIRSDNANAGGDNTNNDQPGWQEFDDFTNTNTNTVIHPMYKRNYIGIARVNALLQFNQVENNATVEVYKAEALFLRAYYHFELFRHFGPVPVVTTVLAPDEVNRKRNTMSELMQQVVDDCAAAAAVLPVRANSGEEGRATKGAALALMGKAYLYWADLKNDDAALFGKARDAFQQVVDLGVYELEDNMRGLFSFDSRNTKEAVFEIQHNPLWSSDWGWYEGIDGNGMIQLCGIRGLCSNHPRYEAGWGFMMVTPSLWNHFLSDDEYRRDVAIASDEALAKEIADSGVACNTAVDKSQANPIDYTGYWQQKYANYKAFAGGNVNGGNEHLTKSLNTKAIRYADVLLMLAEAIHRSGGADGDALKYIDMVRERAAGPGDNTGKFRTGSTVMAQEGWNLLQLIWYERRAELACEGDRWFDLVRSGRANANLFTGDGDKASTFSAQHLWLPVSLEETQLATGMTTYPDPSLFQ